MGCRFVKPQNEPVAAKHRLGDAAMGNVPLDRNFHINPLNSTNILLRVSASLQYQPVERIFVSRISREADR